MHTRPQALARVALVIVACCLAVLAAASGASGADTYWSGIAAYQQPGFVPGWNYYHFNEAYNNPWGQVPLLRAQEHLPNGNWVSTFSANGWIDVCHAREYTEVGCTNLSGSSYSVTCRSSTSPC
jgi:hypothetical protein